MRRINEYEELKLLARKLGVTQDNCFITESNDNFNHNYQLLCDVRAFVCIHYKIWINAFSQYNFGEEDFTKIEITIKNGVFREVGPITQAGIFGELREIQTIIPNTCFKMAPIMII